MRSIAANLAVLAACAGLVLVVVYQRHGAPVILEDRTAALNQGMEARIEQDERRLMADVKMQQQMLRAQAAQQLAARSYGDGCKCECPPSGCDEENHEGPVCSCPGEGDAGMPPPFAPFNFDASASARRRRAQPLHMQQARSTAQQPAHMQQAWRLPDKLAKIGHSVTFPPFFANAAERKEQTAPQPARMQQKWVGSPMKMLPPDGDYPGGQTGIPLDGYLAYETGWANDGPFHGELAPMQEAGIAKSRPQQLRQRFANTNHLLRKLEHKEARRPRLGSNEFGSSFDERVPASAIDRDLFTSGLRPKGPTVNAFDAMMH